MSILTILFLCTLTVNVSNVPYQRSVNHGPIQPPVFVNKVLLEYSQLFVYGCFPTGLPRWLSGKESTCQCRRHKRHQFNPWVRMIPLEEEMATHSSILACKVPWTEEPGGLQSMGSLRVGHNWVTSLSLFTFMHWRRKWQPTPVFLPGESQGWGSLVGCRLWGPTESDTTVVT